MGAVTVAQAVHKLVDLHREAALEVTQETVGQQAQTSTMSVLLAAAGAVVVVEIIVVEDLVVPVEALEFLGLDQMELAAVLACRVGAAQMEKLVLQEQQVMPQDLGAAVVLA